LVQESNGPGVHSPKARDAGALPGSTNWSPEQAAEAASAAASAARRRDAGAGMMVSGSGNTDQVATGMPVALVHERQ
jgi:hypothetical protein